MKIKQPISTKKSEREPEYLTSALGEKQHPPTVIARPSTNLIINQIFTLLFLQSISRHRATAL